VAPFLDARNVHTVCGSTKHKCNSGMKRVTSQQNNHVMRHCLNESRVDRIIALCGIV